MRALTARAAAQVLLKREGPALISDRPLRIAFQPSATAFRLEVPEETFRTVSLAYVILMSDVPTDDEPDFAGGSLWLRDWDIWGGGAGRVGCDLLRSIREASGIDGAVKESPVLILGPGEIALAHSALTLALLFQWDAFYLPESAHFFAFASHDGYVDLVASRPSVLQRLYERFSRGGWSPSMA